MLALLKRLVSTKCFFCSEIIKKGEKKSIYFIGAGPMTTCPKCYFEDAEYKLWVAPFLKRRTK